MAIVERATNGPENETVLLFIICFVVAICNHKWFNIVPFSFLSTDNWTERMPRSQKGFHKLQVV